MKRLNRVPMGRRAAGFTLLELLLAVSLLAVTASVTFMAFFTATRAWKRGVALSDSLHHGDFVVDQLSLALRSAYYPDTGGSGDEYGFLMENRDGSLPCDEMSWVKLGGALVGSDWPAAGSPHRVRVSVTPYKDGRDAVSIRAWRIQGQPDEFDPEEEVEPVFLSQRIHGLNCRPAYKLDDGTIEWRDEWEDTNRIPLAVEVTLYVEPVDEGEPSVEVKRVISIPVAERTWEVSRRGGGGSTSSTNRVGGRPSGSVGRGDRDHANPNRGPSPNPGSNRGQFRETPRR